MAREGGGVKGSGMGRGGVGGGGGGGGGGNNGGGGGERKGGKRVSQGGYLVRMSWSPGMKGHQQVVDVTTDDVSRDPRCGVW